MKNFYGTGIFGLVVEDKINWDTDKIVSFSQYSSYKACPKKWELKYVRKHKIPQTSIHFVYGTAMHETIQEYVKILFTKSFKAGELLDTSALLLKNIRSEYLTAIEANNNVHFSTKEELATFYKDGVEIINYLKKKRKEYFNKDMQLIAIELPMNEPADPNRPTIKLQCHLDLIFYNKSTKKYLILDLKTTTKGWNDYKKKDKKTTDQLVLYKKFFADKFDIPLENIDIEYLILRQKIDPDSLWPMKRLQKFAPANGKTAIKQLTTSFQDFLDQCFDEKGQYIDRNHPAFAGRNGFNCNYCDYRDMENLCPSSNRIFENT